MEKSGNGQPEEGNAVSTSKKTRRSVGRSFSWRRSKKTKMEEVDKGQSFDNSYDIDAESFEKRKGTHEMSYDEDEMSDLDQTGSTSKKRKRFAMWKAVKRIFTRKSGKGSKSFTAGESSSPTLHPQRSISDPNLMRRTDPPELAPLEQVSDSSKHTEAVTTSYAPKKALSHDSLISELRSKRGISIENEKDEETSRCSQTKPTIIVSHETQGINWKVAPSSDPERLVPGLNVSHDKIRVAPRHRRAPTRRGVASTRRHITEDDNVIPRSNSVGVSSPSSLLKKQQESVNFDDLIQSLRSHQEENTTDENKKEIIEVNMKEEPGSEQGDATEEIEKNESISDENEIRVSTDIHDIIKKDSNVNQDPGLNEEQENIKEVETLTMEITSPVFVVATPEVKIENCEEKDQQSVEEAQRYSDHGSVPLSTPIASTDHDGTNNLADTAVSLSKTEIVDSVDANISPVITVESVPVEDDKPTFEEAPTAHLVELTESDPEPVSESISETISKGSVEAIPNNQKAATETLPCPVSEPVPLDLPAADKANAPVIPKVESEQKTNRSISSKEYSEQSSTINDVIIVETKSTESRSVETTVTSPVRSRRLNIETPENVFQKPIMPKVVINENADTSQPETNGIPKRRPQSLYVEKSTYAQDEKDNSNDDSSAGVAKLTQAFERANTISYGGKIKKPEILPKPKIVSEKPAEAVQTSNDMKTKSLGRNFRISASTKKSNDKPLKEALGQREQQKITNANDDTVVINDQDVLDRNKINEKSEIAVSAPKPAPKPKLYKESTPASKTKNDTTVLNYEGKENIEGDNVPSKPIRNGSTKRSEESLNNKMNIADEKKDVQSEVVMPSFWARRSRFSSDSSSEQPTNHPGSPEKSSIKELAKTTPFIQPKTDMCAVCGSKVYQMEKFKVKDNIVHKRCIKCCACKRLLSVGNFIMSQDKIYCSLHEPSHTIALSI